MTIRTTANKQKRPKVLCLLGAFAYLKTVIRKFHK
jgi:hypothetical protein